MPGGGEAGADSVDLLGATRLCAPCMASLSAWARCHADGRDELLELLTLASQGSIQSMICWSAGDSIVLREVRQGRVWSAKPVIVVRDAPNIIALYIKPGIQWKQPCALDGRRVGVTDVESETWVLRDRTWTGGGALLLHTPGTGHALLGFYDEAQAALVNWYLNLQEPLRRTVSGFDYLDQWLDLVIRPDRQSWFWKDKDEFAEAQARGLIDKRAAAAIRAEGARALALLREGRSPYAIGWQTWRPEVSWTVPQLPAGWDQV